MSTFYIASLKHTDKSHEHITWWQRFHRGYTPVLGEYAGLYCYGEASDLNDGRDYIAVPAEAVQKLMSPEPYFENRTGLRRWYDQRGPVVDNTRANWNALIAARLLPEGCQFKPNPEVFRGTRRAIHAAGELQAA
jgi:hypothetical protein